MKTTIPAEDSEERLAHLTKTAWQAFTRVLQIGLMEHTVSIGHWEFLRVLWARDGLTQKELSVEAGVVEATTHAAIKTMEKLGYIIRRRANENKKNKYVYLTKKGRDLEVLLVPIAVTVNDVAISGISEKDIRTTRRCLTEIARNLAKFEAGSADQKPSMPSTRELRRRIERSSGM